MNLWLDTAAKLRQFNRKHSWHLRQHLTIMFSGDKPPIYMLNRDRACPNAGYSDRNCHHDRDHGPGDGHYSNGAWAGRNNLAVRRSNQVAEHKWDGAVHTPVVVQHSRVEIQYISGRGRRSQERLYESIHLDRPRLV